MDKENNNLLDYYKTRNKKLEETLRKAYIALKKHELYDIDIVGEAMGILDETAWGVMNSFDRIEDLRSQLYIAEDELLRSRGWSYTSDTPDSVWMWKKEYNGRVYLTSQDRALSMEDHGIW